jgi:glutathione-regulated potassium-efflux system ancillary protein KefG
VHTLVLVSHPNLARSKAHARLLAAIRGIPGVEIRHLEALYPDRRIDITAEQAAAARARRIVFQFPFYWYTTPPMLKQWEDDVLEFGWAYGPGGTHLHGKTLQLVLSTGGPEATYHPDGYNRYAIRELLRPLEVTASLTGMKFAEPLVLWGVPNIPGLVVPDDRGPAIDEFAASYRTLLARLE